MKDTRLVTDKPDLVGLRDGIEAAITREPKNRVEQLPEEQKEVYSDSFRRGAKYATKDEDKE
jgi:hypothetical protein